MFSIKIGDISVGATDKIFIIAEIGQNHQGNLEIAKKMILSAKKCGCDCVKFQKSCLTSKFTKNALNRRYDGINSWGKTYKEHKEFLEFSDDNFKELQNFANNNQIMFTASAMDEISFDFLVSLSVPFIKIGSGDANNFILLEKAARLSIPLIISTGMQTMSTIRKIVELMKSYKKVNFSLLHCISSYPVKPKNAALNLIQVLKNEFPNVIIGYSGHEEGFIISQAAVLLGAKVIERHFTLDKKQKGSDHKCSLDPNELNNFVSSIRNFEKRLNLNENKSPENVINILKKEQNLNTKECMDLNKALGEITERIIFDCENECRLKLGKSLCYSRSLEKGRIIEKSDLVVKVSEPFGISAEFLEKFIHKKLKLNVNEDDNVSDDHFFMFK